MRYPTAPSMRSISKSFASNASSPALAITPLDPPDGPTGFAGGGRESGVGGVAGGRTAGARVEGPARESPRKAVVGIAITLALHVNGLKRAR